MKKKYSSPEFEFVNLSLTDKILVLSDPEFTDPGGGDIIEPGANPFV